MKKRKKKYESTGLTRQIWDPCHKSMIIKQKKFNIKNVNIKKIKKEKKKKKAKKKLKAYATG